MDGGVDFAEYRANNGTWTLMKILRHWWPLLDRVKGVDYANKYQMKELDWILYFDMCFRKLKSFERVKCFSKILIRYISINDHLWKTHSVSVKFEKNKLPHLCRKHTQQSLIFRAFNFHNVEIWFIKHLIFEKS